MTTRTHLGHNGLAEVLGVTRHAVYKWRSRYPAGSDAPSPEPDVEIDGSPGWSPDRRGEVVEWRESLPGRGAGGGRPPSSRRVYLAAALERGFTHDEAVRMVDSFAAEYPEMTERDIHAWLVDEWRAASPTEADRRSAATPSRWT